MTSNVPASNVLTRREASARLIALASVVGFFGEAQAMTSAGPTDDNGVSRNCECIHQEVAIKATRARVYRALTDANQFKSVTQLSLPGASTEISPEVGGAFSLFGGQILGRHIEMVPDVRLVQAWREKSWTPGVYSIVRFQLSDEGSGTRLVFDHTGFPEGAAGHLAIGWKSHYWEPLQKYLA